MLTCDDDRRERLLTAFSTLDYCESLSNQALADLLFDVIVVELPVLSPEFALLSTIVDRLRQGDRVWHGNSIDA